MTDRQLPDGYTVKYVHSRNVEPDPEAGGLPVLLPTGGQTVAKVLNPDGEQVAEGEATCRPDENFSKPLGRTIALGRALALMEGRGEWPDGSEQ